MKKNRQKGFILLLIIVLLPMIGVAFIVLSSSSRTLLFETQNLQAQTDAANILLSTTAWIQNHPEYIGKDKQTGTVNLDMETLNIPNALSKVEFTILQDEQKTANIHLSFTKGSKKFNFYHQVRLN